jgi:hypothetical protein
MIQQDTEHQRGAAQTATYLDEQGRYHLGGQARPKPPVAGDEVAMLLGYLERQRATFAWKCGGLDAARLCATLGSSPMTLGGMLKHLARFEDDMSNEWLLGRGHLPPWNTVDWTTDRDWDWRTAADDPPRSSTRAGGTPWSAPVRYSRRRWPTAARTSWQRASPTTTGTRPACATCCST